MFEPSAPGAPAPTAPTPSPAATAAEAEINQIVAGTHARSAGWKNSNREDLDYVTSLRRVVAGEPAEQKPIEQKPGETPEIAEIDAEIAHEKEIGTEELHRRWGDKDSPTFQKNAEAVTQVSSFLFNENDENEYALRDAFADNFGRDPDIVDEMLQLKPRLGDVLNRPPAKVTFENLTPEAYEQIADKGRLYLRQNLEGTPLLKKLEAFTEAYAKSSKVNGLRYGNWLLRIGQQLFTESGEPKSTLNKEDAKAAERELSQFRDGTHALTEKWKQRDPAAQAHFENLLKRTTGGK